MNRFRIILCSDSHGDMKALQYLKNTYDSTCYFLHCGDSCFHHSLMKAFGFTCVAGNNDYFGEYPANRILTFGSHRIYMCHGHRDMFFGHYEMLAEKAKLNDCDIAVCGHSHIYHEERVNGVLCLNPGSLLRNRDLSAPSYMLVDIEGEEVTVVRHSPFKL